jgi:hypothetical protein
MISQKFKSIDFTISPCKKVPDIAIIMGIHFDVCHAALFKLHESFSYDNMKGNKIYTGSEKAALAYALYTTIRDKMVGSPLELAKSRVSRIEFDAQEGKFMISWNTQGSVSMLRKTIGIAMSAMNPHKLYSRYATNCKNLGCSSDRNVFNNVANEMADVIKKGIKIATVGKIKIDDAKVKDLLTKVEKKLPKLSNEKNSTKPPTHDKFVHDFPTVKASGITSAVVEDYIRSQGMGTASIGSEIIVYNKSFETKKNSFKTSDRIKTYVKQKYEKLGADFSCVFTYLCITQLYCTCCSATQLLTSKPSANSMVSLIQKALS